MSVAEPLESLSLGHFLVPLAEIVTSLVDPGHGTYGAVEFAPR